jgi:hypothetical protein
VSSVFNYLIEPPLRPAEKAIYTCLLVLKYQENINN